MNDKTLDRDIEQVENDLSEPIPDTPPEKTEKTKVATKKVVKKAAPSKTAPANKANGKAAPAKVAKKASPDVEGMVKLSTLAGEAKISTQRARQKLRAAELDRGDGRWSWKEGSRDLTAARKALGI